MKSNLFGDLAQRAKSSVNYSLESLSVDDAKLFVVVGGIFAACTAVGTGYYPLTQMYDSYQANTLMGAELIQTFKDHIHDVFTLDGEQNTLTGLGIYGLVGVAVANKGATLISNVNRMANKFFPELYESRIDKAAENVSNVFNEISKHSETNLQSIVQETSIYRYLAGVDDIKDTAVIFTKAANLVTNNKLVQQVDKDMTYSVNKL